MERAITNSNTAILKEPKHKELIENLIEEINNLESDDPIHKWQTFTSLVKSRSITYSKVRGKIKKSVKNRLQEEYMKLENNPHSLENEYNLHYYN